MSHVSLKLVAIFAIVAVVLGVAYVGTGPAPQAGGVMSLHDAWVLIIAAVTDHWRYIVTGLTFFVVGWLMGWTRGDYAAERRHRKPVA